MDIQKEKWDYTAMLVAEEAITQDQCDTLKLSDGMNVFYSYKLASTTLDCINWGWSAWLKAKAQAVPEGFVLVPREPTEEMLGAAWEAPPAGGPSGNRRFFYKKQAVVYKAMVDEAEKEMIEAQEKNMKNQVCIGRHINGISINPLEYLLDDNGEVKLFADEVTAKAHLANLGVADEDAYWMVFKAQEQG